MAFYHYFCVLFAIILAVGRGVSSSECTPEMMNACMKDAQMPQQSSSGQVDLAAMCDKSKAAVACLEGLVKDCKNSVKQAAQTSLTVMQSQQNMCGGGPDGSKCDMGKLQKDCPMKQPANKKEACKLLPVLKKCFANFKECTQPQFAEAVKGMKKAMDEFKGQCAENHATSVIGSTHVIFTAAIALLLSHFYF